MASTKSSPKLVVIDGYSLLFRAFFAPGPYLSTADGLPTAALFVFTNGLLTVLDQENPDSFYVAWDPPGKTFRHEAFAEYKGHRPEAGEDLKRQIPVARELVQTLGIAAAEAPRFEADDMIGTLATRGVKEGYEVVIVTGDTDQLQLVGDGVTVRMVRRGVSETKLYDEAAVQERYGLPPERVPEYKALVGDTSDNIPGVTGIGDKTATKLLQEYSSLEELLAHAADLPPGRVRENLLAAGEQPIRSRELATIHCDAPFDGPISRFEPTAETWAAARALFERLEFRTLLRRLPEPAPAEVPAPETLPPFVAELEQVDSGATLDRAISEALRAGRVATRLHADAAQPMRANLLGLAFASSPSKAYYVRLAPSRRSQPADLFSDDHPAESGYAATLESISPLLASEIQLDGHNAKFDAIVLARNGLTTQPPAFDSMIAAYLLAPGRSGYPLGELVQEHLGARLGGDVEAAEIALAREAAAVFALRDPMRQRLEEHALTWVMDHLELPLVPVLAEMERTGVPVDRDWLRRLSLEMEQKIAELTACIYGLAGEEFTIGSTQQLQRILFEKLQLPTGKKIKTGYSTSADLLESLAPQYDICARILDYREASKLKSTYADALPKLINPATGRLHTSLNQTVAATGRLSSSDPNLQNIPVRTEIGREIRRAFIAPLGQTLLSCDYSQIELRVFAHVTGDAEMRRAFDADEDIHAATATRLFNVELDQVTSDMRRRAKTVNFAVIYGQSDFGLATNLGIPNAEAKVFIDSYFATFPGVKKYTQETLEHARAHGYVQTLMGRRRYLPEINSGNFNIRQAAERAAVNMPIQGTAADIMKLAMIDVHRWLQSMCYNCALLLQVHDELVFALEESLVPEIAPQIVRMMEKAFALEVPLRVDAKAGPNWADMSAVVWR